MASVQAQVGPTHPLGYPEARVAGLALSLKFFIAGEAVAQSRPRGRVVQGPKPFVQFYEEKASSDWKVTVAELAREQVRLVEVEGDGDFTLPASGRILMTVRFNLRKPPSYSKKVVHHTKKPDVDNLVKAVLDGLVQGRIISDDNCVTDLMVSKRYSTPEHPEGVEVDMTVLPGND